MAPLEQYSHELRAAPRGSSYFSWSAHKTLQERRPHRWRASSRRWPAMKARSPIVPSPITTSLARSDLTELSRSRDSESRLHDLRTRACPKLTRWSAVVLEKTDTRGGATCRIFLPASLRPIAVRRPTGSSAIRAVDLERLPRNGDREPEPSDRLQLVAGRNAERSRNRRP